MTDVYCTIDDVRRALRTHNLPGDVEQDMQIAIDAITAETLPLEKELQRHFYDTSANNELASEPKTRDDEYDIPTRTFVHGDSERKRHARRRNSDTLLESGRHRARRRERRRAPKREIRLAFGDLHDDSRPAYTRIGLERRDVQAVTELHVVNEDAGFDDWVADDNYEGGVGNAHRGEDYWVRINNRGVSELSLDVHAMDDDLPSLANAVYVEIEYGHEGIPQPVRRAVALRAAAELVEEAVIDIPQGATIYDVDTKAEVMQLKADELLEDLR